VEFKKLKYAWLLKKKKKDIATPLSGKEKGVDWAKNESAGRKKG